MSSREDCVASGGDSARFRSRRRFLKATLAAVAAPSIIPASALGADGSTPPSERVAMGCIGVGGQGSGDMWAFLSDRRVQVVAVCDVDAQRRDGARQAVESHYGRSVPSGAYRGCAATTDFRDLLLRRDIDAVIIGTPDHWHAIISIEAMRSSKDAYCEKPLSYSVVEGRAIADAERRYGRVLQTGTQRRSMAAFRHTCELVRNGRIGRLHTIRVGLPRGFAIAHGDFEGNQAPAPVPPGFDYDLWLGPAPYAPYTPGRCHFNFRWILDYGEGYISDWGAHYMDVAQWGQGADRSGPVRVGAWARFPATGLYDAPTDFSIEYTYADGVRTICSTEETLGMRFEGDEGWIHAEKPGAAGVVAEPASVLDSTIGPNEIRLPESPGHHANFIDCVLSRRETVAPAEIGHRSAAVCHVGCIAAILGRELEWDPEQERFVGDAEANRMLSRPMRGEWHL